MIGQAVELLIPNRFRKKHPLHREGYYSEHHVRPMGVGLVLFGLRKNGTEFPIEISLSPLETETACWSVPQSAISPNEGRGGHSQLNEDLKQRAAQLEAANKELSLSAILSHDLRAPLRSIDGFSHIVLEDYGEKPSEGREYWNVCALRHSAWRS
jgi:protein-histidine pros-kinase